MSKYRISGIAINICFVLLFSQISFPDPVRIAASGDVIQMGVVVLDKSGHQITDLTADDFEIYHNGQLCEITSGVYIDYLADDTASSAGLVEGAPIPGSMTDTLSPGYQIISESGRSFDTNDFYQERMRSTHAFDDFYQESMRSAQREIYNIKDRMQSGDLILIAQTGYGSSAMDIFLSDSHRIIDQIDWWAARRSYVNGYLLDTQSKEHNISEVLSSEIFGIEIPDLSSYLVKTTYGNSGGNVTSEFINGIGLTNKREDKNGKIISGYYRISYIPAAVDNNSQKNYSHHVKVNVKRKDMTVHMRAGRFGEIKHYIDAKSGQAMRYGPSFNPRSTNYIPFTLSDMLLRPRKVNMYYGYMKDAKNGYLMRSFIHIDANALKMRETDEGARVEFKIEWMLTNTMANYFKIPKIPIEYRYSSNHSFDITHENIEWIKEHGIRLTQVFPVKKNESYHVDIRVWDSEGEITGNYRADLQSVPDFNKKGFTLSSIFPITSAADLKWIFSDATEEIKKKGDFSPVFMDSEARSPANLFFKPGDSIQTLALLYNADAKAIAKSEIEARYILYKDGVEFRRGEPIAITADNDKIAGGIPIIQQYTLEPDMHPGTYSLYLFITDKKNSGRKDQSDTVPRSPIPVKEGDVFQMMYFGVL